MRDYTLLSPARQQLIAIASYTKRNFGLRKWREYRGILTAEFQKLTENPTIGSQSNIPPKHVKNGVRKVIAGVKKRDRNHYICYRKNAATGNIDIIAIIHTSRDLYRDLSRMPIKQYKPQD